MPAPSPPFKRLLSSYTVNTNTKCWEWIGSKYNNGYGWLKVFGRKNSSHRYSYELHKGPIPAGLEVMHSCDNRKCINPDHLSVGTHAQNMSEAKERGRMPSGKAHAFYGKPKNPANSQSIAVIVMGKKYASMKLAERSLGLGSGTVRWWMKNGHTHKARKA